MVEIIYYECDPEKNVDCKKYRCLKRTQNKDEKGWCKMTKKKECAKLDEFGTPIIAEVQKKRG